MLKIRGPWLVDEQGRTVMLRGVNLGGSSKVPTRPNGASYNPEGFFEHREVSFVGRPFPLSEADEHYARLRHWGFNCLRFLITWEAVEHAGPGIYDQEYLEYLHTVVKKADEYGLHVFIDPHQDVYSRFSGGDGAPGWTLEAAGFDIRNFKETGAAIVHQTHGDPFPRMIWPTNAYKLAAATMFTLFFAGNDFAPKTKVNDVPIQEYLQGHYFNAMKAVAKKLKDIDCVMGFDTLNEPQRGYIGLKDLRPFYGLMDLGTVPTPWQSIQLGSGFTQTVKRFERDLLGVHDRGDVVVNPSGQSAWLPGRECVWKQNGVWDLDPEGKPRLLKPDYFHKVGGREVSFIQDYLKPFMQKMVAAIRTEKKEWIGFIESEVANVSPDWPEAAQENMVYVPHWYDVVLLLLKTYVTFVGANEYTQKVVLGKRNVERSFREQLAEPKQFSREKLGNIPVLLGEFGIPFDMGKKRAYKTGDFRKQVKALDRSMRALEANLLNYTLWNYTADNTNDRGDLWNDEDLSLFSRDQQNDPTDLNSGGRALQAAVRPFAMRTAGEPLMARFEPISGRFEFEFRGDPTVGAPTEIFFPALHYPQGAVISLSDGSVEIDQPGQVLRYIPGKEAIHRIALRPKR